METNCPGEQLLNDTSDVHVEIIAQSDNNLEVNTSEIESETTEYPSPNRDFSLNNSPLGLSLLSEGASIQQSLTTKDFDKILHHSTSSVILTNKRESETIMQNETESTQDVNYALHNSTGSVLLMNKNEREATIQNETETAKETDEVIQSSLTSVLLTGNNETAMQNETETAPEIDDVLQNPLSSVLLTDKNESVAIEQTISSPNLPVISITELGDLSPYKPYPGSEISPHKASPLSAAMPMNQLFLDCIPPPAETAVWHFDSNLPFNSQKPMVSLLNLGEKSLVNMETGKAGLNLFEL